MILLAIMNNCVGNKVNCEENYTKIKTNVSNDGNKMSQVLAKCRRAKKKGNTIKMKRWQLMLDENNGNHSTDNGYCRSDAGGFLAIVVSE